ncbi:MAG: protein translocase subunit SecF [Deltaproteobacteria bacterium]|nr:MAG: protein translocase subunit SecF [Deltaproteobacteria bacterium]
MFQLKGFHFDYVGYRKWFVAFSAITIILGIFFIAKNGLNFGTDFKGGTKLQYLFQTPTTDGDVRKAIEKVGIESFSVQKIGEAQENRFIIKLEMSDDVEAVVKKVTESLQASVGADKVTLEQNETVGPKAGADLRKKAELSIIVSWLLMLIYIGFRFDFAFAPGAIVALIHDVLLAVAGFAITGREVSLTVVAAILTIIGYSINDTIVVYDRVREHLANAGKQSLKEIINRSINEMFPRTIITSFTVFIVVALMYFFGEGEFQNFGFAMIIGVVTGVYSTLSIACPLYIWIKDNEAFLKKFAK